jgi:hypothetical protein
MVALTGVGIIPKLFSSSTVLSFGNGALGLVYKDSIYVKNTGSGTLRIDSIRTKTIAFAITPNNNVNINASDSLKFIVTFTVTSTGAKNDTVSFYHNAIGSPYNIPVNGTGVAPEFSSSSSAISYGDVLVGSSKKDSVYLKNIGSALLKIDSVRTTSQEFAVTLNRSVTINPSDSLVCIVTFSPLSTGAKNDTVSFFDNAVGSPHKIPLSGNGAMTSAEEQDEGVPREFLLSQNFPNPFNPSTTLRYGVPITSRVRLLIYNTLGQVVAELVDGEQARGWYKVSWIADVSTGIYFYRIEAVGVADPNNNFVQVKKMLLLK